MSRPIHLLVIIQLLMYESKRLFTYTHIYVCVCSFKASIILLRLVLIVALFFLSVKMFPTDEMWFSIDFSLTGINEPNSVPGCACFVRTNLIGCLL